MKLIITLLFSISFSLCAQINIKLQSHFEVNVNDSIIEFSNLWFDSLITEANNSKIYYQISGYESSNRISTAKLKIPQTLKLNEIIRQVIFYYSLLESEQEKEKEQVLLFPFFVDITKPEYIKCNYANKTFYFKLREWITQPKPLQPTPEEKYIYNQIMKNAIEKTMVFGEVPENSIKEISLLRKKPFNEINEVYKKVTLWNACR